MANWTSDPDAGRYPPKRSGKTPVMIRVGKYTVIIKSPFKGSKDKGNQTPSKESK